MCASQRSADGSVAAPAPLIDASAAAELLNVRASWVLAQARKEAIPHVRLGRYVRFSQEELLDWARNTQHRGPGR